MSRKPLGTLAGPGNDSLTFRAGGSSVSTMTFCEGGTIPWRSTSQSVRPSDECLAPFQKPRLEALYSESSTVPSVQGQPRAPHPDSRHTVTGWYRLRLDVMVIAAEARRASTRSGMVQHLSEPTNVTFSLTSYSRRVRWTLTTQCIRGTVFFYIFISQPFLPGSRIHVRVAVAFFFKIELNVETPVGVRLRLH